MFIVLLGFFRQGEEGSQILETQGLLANKGGSDGAQLDLRPGEESREAKPPDGRPMQLRILRRGADPPAAVRTQQL